MRDYLKGKRCMVWTFMGNSRMYQALRDYGDRFDTVGVFCFKVDKTGKITETESMLKQLETYITKWPHIRWLLTVSNDGYSSIFDAIRENTDGAQDTFLSELIRLLEKYTWADGVDIDLEKGGAYSNRAKANTLFKNIYNRVKSYNSKKEVNICLPGMTGVQGSVGGENWCVYADLDPYCDTCAIMSYGMAWAGSAPGPVSPKSWLDGIYDYAASVMTPSKIYLGMPSYGWNWRIHQSLEDMGRTYRGSSQTYYAAKNWLNGLYNFTDDAPPQPFIPFVAYWDDYNKVPWALPHVYDFMEGPDAISYTNPLTAETYNRRRYLTAYSKQQKVTFGDIYVDGNGGTPTKKSGVVNCEENYAVLGNGGKLEYKFSVGAGTYDIAFKICYPFWHQNGIKISIDGTSKTYIESRLWWPYWRTTCWLSLVDGMYLSAGEHTLTVENVVEGVMFFGYRVCSNFTDTCYGGEATFKVSPRSFIDVDGNSCVPDKGFRLTPEVLRRSSDSALVWYEDFRDGSSLPESYWTTLAGKFEIWQEDPFARRPYSQLEGKGELAWKYDGFRDIHIRCRMAIPADGGGKSGVFVGNLFLCINYDSQRLELYQNGTLLGSYASSYSKTSEKELRSNPSTYTFEMRIRGNKVRVYSGTSYTLRFTATASGFVGGFAGFKAEKRAICELLRLGDAWSYEPYERFDVTFPNGSTKSYGRIARSNAKWDEHFQVFTLTADVEESSTRSESISMEYDFFHSDILNMECGKDYEITIRPVDINVWISRLFLGDADGFSILYYQDVDSLVYWSNQAAYKWKLRGMAVWSLGQEDMRLWEALPKQTG